jgi:hypothetical protein
MDHSLPTPAIKFLEAIRPWQHAYAHSTLTYVAIHSGGNDVLVRGRLALRAFAPPTRRGRIQSSMFRADEVDLSVAQPHALRDKDNLDVALRLDGYDDCRDLPNITRGLVKRGYTDEQIKGILGENALRVFEQVCGA